MLSCPHHSVLQLLLLHELLLLLPKQILVESIHRMVRGHLTRLLIHVGTVAIPIADHHPARRQRTVQAFLGNVEEHLIFGQLHAKNHLRVLFNLLKLRGNSLAIDLVSNGRDLVL